MKISGFTMVRNADKYYFPIRESILSVLTIVDEYIVALGDSDADDKTREIIESIQSPKVKIIDRKWDEVDFVDGRIFANETNYALSQCSGDWCIYLQADEVVHENGLQNIVGTCSKYLNKDRVDGILLNFHHFYGDYNHYLPIHGWCKQDIRVLKNHRNIYSHKDANSFRKGENEKLNVVDTAARLFHYGWVRPPERMQSKKKEQDSMHHGKTKIQEVYRAKPQNFDYGPLGRVPVFRETHPEVMADFIKKMNWQDELNFTRKGKIERPKMKHEKHKYRMLSFLEKHLKNGREFGGYSNWNKANV
ncbi:MAG: glycosyltransferase [Bacteroidetes bacterium]|nr:glycosyltransferase [Bacteroidota bacterium]MBU1718661.1 glycosyltransferase [Bacteroidota bacterium]